MAARAVRARDKDTLAQFLGWFSLGLGAAEVAAPKLMCKVVGADGGKTARTIMRSMGLREIAQGIGVLTRPRPTNWLWARVAGDGLDLSLLLLVAAKHRRARTAFALANVAAVTVPDVFESLHLSQQRGEPQGARLVRKAVTIRKPRQEVEQAWANAEELRRKVDGAGAFVSFSDAPGNRGTELAVEFVHDPPGGDLGAAVQKLTGNDLATELADDLRRLKQQLETGEVVRSDSTPAGHSLANHLRQRAAQPVKEAV